MKRVLLAAPALLVAALTAACASGGAKAKDPGLGRRTLDCVVVQREHDAAGSSASSYRGSGTGSYYMVFETREGQATSRYRLEVTRQQYQRFEEGDRVKITLDNNILVNVQPNND
ncbi:MAG TPA: hypothetical protein VMN82_15960 [Thermoanaerobaculia bacterium]|nr:hypothetical protein [Thermoanaerobaculia bacterium]